MPGRNFLFVPGPTNIPDRVMRAMVVAMEDHRSSKFPEQTLALFEDLKQILASVGALAAAASRAPRCRLFWMSRSRRSLLYFLDR